MKRNEILEIIKTIKEDPTVRKEFLRLLIETLDLRENPFHPLVFVNGSPKVGKNVYIGLFSEINAKGAGVVIGDNCDIASFVSINVADSHKKCIGSKKEDERRPIDIGDNTFIGSHCFIKGGAHIGHHSVVAAGTIVEGVRIPPYSLIYGNPMKVKEGHYKHIEAAP
jgi:acetyltransferase-like isoleucine patch superfamily enzyme